MIDHTTYKVTSRHQRHTKLLVPPMHDVSDLCTEIHMCGRGLASTSNIAAVQKLLGRAKSAGSDPK